MSESIGVGLDSRWFIDRGLVFMTSLTCFNVSLSCSANQPLGFYNKYIASLFLLPVPTAKMMAPLNGGKGSTSSRAILLQSPKFAKDRMFFFFIINVHQTIVAVLCVYAYVQNVYIIGIISQGLNVVVF